MSARVQPRQTTPWRVRAEALAISPDGHRGEELAGHAVAHMAVARVGIALDVDAIPLFCVAHVVNRHVVVLAPEEGRVLESLRLAEHVQRRDLSLTLRQHPVFDAD